VSEGGIPVTGDAWQALFAERTMTADRALDAVRSGVSVFIGSGCGRPEDLLEALLRKAARWPTSRSCTA